MIKKMNFLLLLLLMIVPCYVNAYSDYVIAGGDNIGIELSMDGIMVIGNYDIDGECPALKAGLKKGDKIISINDKPVITIKDITAFLSNYNRDTIKIGYIRNEKKYETQLTLKNKKTGLYLKDAITGIGTLTFIDPNTKIYGALGHEITDSSSGNLVDSKKGIIFSSTIHSITKSRDGIPGEKNASFTATHPLGSITKNTNKGIFGIYQDTISEKKQYKVANIEDVKLGTATIRTVIEGNQIQEYEIKITKVQETKDHTKNIVFQITDSELLEKTGGIIQGMSGSPIIQGEYIVGAVTHVVVNDPEKGYGILITNMLEEAEKNRE